MGYGILIFLLFCCLCSISAVFGQKPLLVNVRNGTLEGSIMTSRKGREFVAFRGIPYAQPPIGDLRFESPRPFGSWTGVRSAKEDSNFCVQPLGQTFIGSEDCLYLNVYTPTLPSSNGGQDNYPVMIWIYGGGDVGSAHSGFYGPQFLLDHDVVHVSMNYRIGALGFLSTQDLVSPGNNGLKDQAQAIRWVHENIAQFNGDPNRVTIFGESAGASYVYYHMISPFVRGLFHRAIAQSGDVIEPWALIRPEVAKNQSIKLGEVLKCPTGNSAAMVSCLKQKNANDIIATFCSSVFQTCPILPFAPTIEPVHPGAYIKEEPEKSVKSDNIADIPLMTGINAQEGCGVTAGILGRTDQPYAQIFNDNFMELAPKSLGYVYTARTEDIDNISRRIRQFYFGDKKIGVATKWDIINMYTDAYFVIGGHATVKAHLAKLHAPVYFYFFDYKGTSSFSSIFGDPNNNYGVCHSDELQYLFPVGGLLFPNATLSAEDLKVVDVMTSLWVNFAKSGNPTPTRTPLIPVRWNPVTTPSLQYLHIRNSTNLQMAGNLWPERISFWNSLPYRAKIQSNRRNK